MKRGKMSGWRATLFDKIQMLAILFFLLGLFVFDVNANNIGAYGLGTKVGVINNNAVPATSMFWLGFLVTAACFFIIAIRSMFYHKEYPTKLDVLFGAIGITGLMIVLSGGMLLFWHNNALLIPFFSWELTRITYYHFGIGISLISLIYFALTK